MGLLACRGVGLGLGGGRGGHFSAVAEKLPAAEGREGGTRWG